mmetsp:Transcript_14184/g.56000  ORF Transcript_14184/g.56000 Transcript_14184/m.56000 type:complete len:254 (-) Transcript_14184:279-1040(-)
MGDARERRERLGEPWILLDIFIVRRVLIGSTAKQVEPVRFRGRFRGSPPLLGERHRVGVPVPRGSHQRPELLGRETRELRRLRDEEASLRRDVVPSRRVLLVSFQTLPEKFRRGHRARVAFAADERLERRQPGSRRLPGGRVQTYPGFEPPVRKLRGPNRERVAASSPQTRGKLSRERARRRDVRRNKRVPRGTAGSFKVERAPRGLGSRLGSRLGFVAVAAPHRRRLGGGRQRGRSRRGGRRRLERGVHGRS